jgi:transposase-like protein
MNREEFVKEATAKTKSFSALCRKYGISRPTGYMWLRRYENGESFSDRSHQTFGTAANKTPQAIEDKIIKARNEEPTIGATKIKRMLENQGESDIPCMSTINAILKRNDLITPEASANATPYKRFEMPAPNDMWQCDFKGHYGLLDGVRCHPLSVIDGQSYFFSEGFRGKTIAIKPSETQENAVNICFREFQVGTIDLTERTVISRKARLMKSDNQSDTAA